MLCWKTKVQLTIFKLIFSPMKIYHTLKFWMKFWYPWQVLCYIVNVVILEDDYQIHPNQSYAFNFFLILGFKNSCHSFLLFASFFSLINAIQLTPTAATTLYPWFVSFNINSTMLYNVESKIFNTGDPIWATVLVWYNSR